MKIMTCKDVLIEKIVSIIQEAELDNSTDYETQIYLRVNDDHTAGVEKYVSVGGNDFMVAPGLHRIGTVRGSYETLGEIWTDIPGQLCDMINLDVNQVIRYIVEVQGIDDYDVTDHYIYKFLDERYHDMIREEVEDMMNWMYRMDYWEKAEGMLDEWAEDRDVEWMTTTDREEV